MPNYVKKMNVKSVKTKYGEILKLGIHKSIFSENAVDGEWLNVDILRSKDDNKPYLVINDYKKSDTQNDMIDTEEIPF